MPVHAKTPCFLNGREWRSFLKEVLPSASAYPKVPDALRAHRAGFGALGARPLPWLSASGSLAPQRAFRRG